MPKRILAWIAAHWKSLGGVAAVGIVGGFVKWLVDIRKSWREGTEAKKRSEGLDRQKIVDEREAQIERYVSEFKRLDQTTPGGLKRVIPEPHDDPDLLREAWERFVKSKRSGQGRFS
jgi:hypothetical protein